MFNVLSQLSEIEDHLYLCRARAMRPDRVKSLGITYVINCTMELPMFKLPGVECSRVPVMDMPGASLGVHFDKSADKIHQVHTSGGKTLVHCYAGVSRSAAICIAYLMKYKKLTLRQAYEHVKTRRPVIHPNVGFWQQLVHYERKLFGKNTVQMVPSGLGPIPDVYREHVRELGYSA